MKKKKFKKNLKKIGKAIKNAQIDIDDLYEYLFELRIDFRKEIRDLFPETQATNIENATENGGISQEAKGKYFLKNSNVNYLQK